MNRFKSLALLENIFGAIAPVKNLFTYSLIYLFTYNFSHNHRKDKTMYHIYTIKNKSEFSKTLVAETKDYDEALEKAEKAIAGKEGYNYVVEETDGSMNSYGELLTTVVAEG